MNVPHRPCRITILSEYAVTRTFFFFFYRQLLSVMNKNVLRILPRSVVGGLKKKRAEQSSSIDSVCIPLVVSLWQHQRLWVCGRSSLALLQPRRDPPSLLSSALSMSLCVHFQASHSLLYHRHRDNTAVQKAARSSLPPSLTPSFPHSLSVSSPPPLRVSQRCYSKFISVVPTTGQWICGLLSI